MRRCSDRSISDRRKPLCILPESPGDSIHTALPPSEPGIRLLWSSPERLGLAASAGTEIGGRTNAIRQFFGPVAVHLVGRGHSLDRRTVGQRGAAAANPYGLVQELLKRCHGSPNNPQLGSPKNPHPPQRRRCGHEQNVAWRSAHHREPGPVGGGIADGRARAVGGTLSSTYGGRTVGLGAGRAVRTGTARRCAGACRSRSGVRIGARRRPTPGWPITRGISTHGRQR